MIKEKGNLESKKPVRSFRKLNPANLKAYVEEHLDAYQKEIAKALGCSKANIQKAMARLKITQKKQTTYQEQDAEKVAASKEEITDIPSKK